MHRELVERRRWIGEERFLRALNYCMLLPGPEAQRLAIFIGWLLHRTWGGIVAGAFFVIPSIFVLLALSYIYAAYDNVPAVAGVLAGFKPVVVAIVIEAVVKIGGKALKRRAQYVLAAAAFVAIYFLHIPFPLIVLAAAGAGLAGVRFWPGAFAASPKTKEADAKTEGKGERRNILPLVIEDHAPPPPHTRPSRGRGLKVIAVGLVLWLLPLLALVAWRGWGSLHAQESRFFTQAALVTFGGSYAVLAYVTQAAAGSYGWLTQAQAVDGLALAETPPGPLIMVLQFVGFMAGWNNPQGLSQPLSAVVGRLVTTYATFLPCFIFLGAPYIEVLRGNKNLTGALTGIMAAVMGVVLNLAIVFGAAVIWPRGLAGGTDFFAPAILNLAIVFGAAVIWPRGLAGGTDFFAPAMSVAAFVTLYKFKADVLWVVIAGGLIGFGWTLLR